MLATLEQFLAWVRGLVEWAGVSGCILAGIVLWYTVRHGWTWVSQKATSIWNSIVGDLTALETRVESLETSVFGAKQTAATTKTAKPVAPAAPATLVAPITAPAATVGASPVPTGTVA